MNHRLSLAAFLLTAVAQLAMAQSMERIVGYVTSSDGVQITYTIQGEAPTAIILVHGWACDRTYWSTQASALAKKYKVVSIDLAGHGGSGTERRVYSMEAFGEDVAAVVNKLELQKVIMVGHSMGGDVIAEAARHLEGRVAGLIMVDTYKKLGAGRSPEEVTALVTRLRPHFKDSAKVLVKRMFVKTSDPALVERISDDMSSVSPRIALSAMEHALSYSRQMPQTLQELTLPVVAINADNAPTDMASMKKYGVQVMIVKGVGHFPMLEDVPKFNGALSAALQKLSGL